MSVVLPSERAEWWAAPEARQCFTCFEPLNESAVVQWAGTENILLHPECARVLGANLIADSREAELASAERPHMVRRLAKALGASLAAQEARR